MPIKILSTVGPATDQKNNISKLLKFGDILRTNGSHNTIKWHEKICALIKSITPEAVPLFDIPGVKTRTKKPNLAQQMRANPGFKWWAVPPKKGPLSQGLKVKPKQVKKV